MYIHTCINNVHHSTYLVRYGQLSKHQKYAITQCIVLILKMDTATYTSHHTQMDRRQRRNDAIDFDHGPVDINVVANDDYNPFLPESTCYTILDGLGTFFNLFHNDLFHSREQESIMMVSLYYPDQYAHAFGGHIIIRLNQISRPCVWTRLGEGEDCRVWHHWPGPRENGGGGGWWA